MCADSYKDIARRAYQLGLKYEQEKKACAQCIVASLVEVFNIKEDGLFRASFGLQGGLACTCDGTCGALSGGILILNYFYGRTREEFESQGFKPLESPKFPWEEKGLVLAKELINRFIEEYGSIMCEDIQKEIIGFKADFWTEKGIEIFDDAGGHKDKCPVVVAKAAQWTAEIILREREKH